MSEFLAKDILPKGFYLQSAGVEAGEADPFMITVMSERGIEMHRHIPRQLEDLEDGFWDLIITLCPEAHHRALEYVRGQSLEVEYWPTMDPSTVAGNREQILEIYRKVRDMLEQKITQRFLAT